MTEIPDGAWVAGIDGCKGGWIVALGQINGATERPVFVHSIHDVFRRKPTPSLIAIDVPIGLPTCSPAGGRGPEPELRKLLRGKASSVFRVPCRAAIYAGLNADGKVDRKKYDSARKIAQENSKDGKAFPLQSLYIFDKITQVDTYLRIDGRRNAKKFYETHPELAFYYMNECAPVLASKKSEEGFRHRRRLLLREGIAPDVIANWPKEAKRDDAIDALACLVTARCLAKGSAKPHPAYYDNDGCNLPMVIWACGCADN